MTFCTVGITACLPVVGEFERLLTGGGSFHTFQPSLHFLATWKRGGISGLCRSKNTPSIIFTELCTNQPTNYPEGFSFSLHLGTKFTILISHVEAQSFNHLLTPREPPGNTNRLGTNWLEHFEQETLKMHPLYPQMKKPASVWSICRGMSPGLVKCCYCIDRRGACVV